MTGWRHSWAVDCAACRRRVLWRNTCWSDRHRARICATCTTPGPAAADYEPAALITALNQQEHT